MGTATAAPAPRNLGRVVAVKQLSKATAILGLLIAAMFAAAGVYSLREIGTAALYFGIAALVLAGALYALTAKFEICENGARSQSLFGKNTVSFDEVKTFKFAEVEGDSDAQVALTLIPLNGKPLRIVAKPSKLNPIDKQLSALNRKLSERFGTKMQEQLTRSGRVEWMEKVAGSIPPQPAISITRDGFVISDGRQDRNVLFAEVAPQMSNGYFFLRNRGDNKVVFRAEVSSPNFYPGWRLIRQMTAPAAAQ